MKNIFIITAITLLIAPISSAGDFIKKLDIPEGYTRSLSYEGDSLAHLDCNDDGHPEFIMRGDGSLTYTALDPNNNYNEVWSFTGNPEDFASPGYSYFYFRFSGFHDVQFGYKHALITFEYYDTAGVQHHGLVFVDIADGSIDWRIDGYHTGSVLTYDNNGATLEDFVLYNAITNEDEIWGYSEVSATPDNPLPSGLLVKQNRPNPFNPSTLLAFSIDHEAETRLEIHDVKGRLVRHQPLGLTTAGDHQWTWHGLDDAGRKVSSGVYFYTVYAGNEQQGKKMVLVR